MPHHARLLLGIALALPARPSATQEVQAFREPPWVAEFVAAGELPPLAERLPPEPVVVAAEEMPDGPGDWGDTLRLSVPGRPEGWNAWAGQSAGGAALDALLRQCLAREGAEGLEPDLAAGWERGEDGGALTVRLLPGLRWSDGDPFDTADVAYLWEALLAEPGRAAFGPGASLVVLDATTFHIEAPAPVPEAALAGLCPGPSHVLAPRHPAGGGPSLDAFREAFPPQFLNLPTLAPWVVVDHWPLDMVVLRRNPFFRKVDAEGRQLPYLDEIQVFLGVEDAATAALTGALDLALLDGDEAVAAAREATADPDAPTRLQEEGGRALAASRRLRNLPPGVPEVPQGWSPEALWVPQDRLGDHELHPFALPGAPGGDGPVEVGGPLARPGSG